MSERARHHPLESGAAPAVERVPDELVDAFFDRELDEGSREKFFGMIRGDLARCEDVARTQRIVSKLREPVEAPDLSEAILARVARRGAFLPRAVRRLVHAGRAAVAAGILLVVLAGAVAHRVWPDLPIWGARQTPVSNVIASGFKEATTGVQQFAGALGSITERMAEPMRQVIVHVEDSPAQVRTQRMYVVGALTPGQLPTVRVLGFEREVSGEITIFGGAGSTLASAAPFGTEQRRIAVVVGPGRLSPSQAGQLAWLRASSRDALILVPMNHGHPDGFSPGANNLPVDDGAVEPPDR